MSIDLDKIRDIWQPASARPLTREDSREIAANVVGLFELLDRWDQQDRQLGQGRYAATAAEPIR